MLASEPVVGPQAAAERPHVPAGPGARPDRRAGISLWSATAPPPPATWPLEATARCDVAVVGGGFTGLTAALRLAEAGIACTLLEAGEIGAGASGRNNGQVIPNFSRIDPDAVVAAMPAELGGAEKGEALVRLVGGSADLVFDLIRQHGIAAEAVQNGWLQPAHRASRMRLAEARVAQWARRGARVRLVSGPEMAELAGSTHWHGGWENAAGGRINPLGYARGLAAAAIRAGAVIHTASPVRRMLQHGHGWWLETPGGALRAERVILATHAMTEASIWPGLRQSLVPVRSYQMATEPLSAAQRSGILPADHALSDTRGDLYFYRFDAAGRLVTGGGLLQPFGWRGRITDRIGARLGRVFPQLRGIRFEHVWWGRWAATPDRLPHLYELAPGVLAWNGCNGRGVGLATAMGQELARAAAGVPAQELAVPLETGLRRVPFHAFRSLGIALQIARNRRNDGRD